MDPVRKIKQEKRKRKNGRLTSSFHFIKTWDLFQPLLSEKVGKKRAYSILSNPCMVHVATFLTFITSKQPNESEKKSTTFHCTGCFNKDPGISLWSSPNNYLCNIVPYIQRRKPGFWSLLICCFRVMATQLLVMTSKTIFFWATGIGNHCHIFHRHDFQFRAIFEDASGYLPWYGDGLRDLYRLTKSWPEGWLAFLADGFGTGGGPMTIGTAGLAEVAIP